MQSGLFNRTRFLNRNRCPLEGHRGRLATRTVTMRTSNPRRPVQTFDVCAECGRNWEKVRGATVTKIGEAA